MEANELKRGNLVILTESTKIEVGDNCHIDDRKALWENKGFAITMIEKDELNLCIGKEDVEFSYSEIKPIPLTEERLVKFGFERDKQNQDTSRIQFRYSSGFVDFIELTNKGSNDEPIWFVFLSGNHTHSAWLLPIKLESVHQLQNLYFVLAGKELKISE